MDFRTLLKNFQEELEIVIKSHPYNSASHSFNEIFNVYTRDFIERGGKRIRPALIYYTYKIFSDKQLQDVLGTSLFIEFIQSWMLIHDDIMDHDDMRRGKKTIHKMFEEISDKYNFEDNRDFGNTFAILSGDYSALLSFEILGNSKLSANAIKNVLAYSAKELQNVVFGQNLDIITSKNEKYTIKDITNIYDLKTARYTFLIPTVTGALLAEAETNYIEYLKKFSIPIGIAFQIRDDILGLFGDMDSTGKSDYKDIAEGKRTILVWKAQQNANEEQQILLNKYLGNPDITQEEAEIVRNIIKETGALEFAENECRRYTVEALTAIELLPNHEGEGWQFLKGVAEYMLVRDK